MTHSLGIVIIGRNEGARLVASLESVFCATDGWLHGAVTVVYVDSGSTDSSAETARRMAVDVLHLDTSMPFSAGRARNSGFDRLRGLRPGIEFVQFIDGDCRLDLRWLRAAVDFMIKRAEYAIVCGRRLEVSPERSVFNALCDAEWNTPIGETAECGGDFLIRAAAFAAVDGFHPDLIAGEEPELCFRLRERGWRIMRLDHPMTLHDAGMTRWSQWWKRSVRSGFAYAARAFLHAANPTGYMKKENVRIAAWAWGVPLAVLSLATIVSPIWWALLLVYPLQVFRLASVLPNRSRQLGRLTRAVFLVLGKWPEGVGQLKFLQQMLLGRRQRIIEYK